MYYRVPILFLMMFALIVIVVVFKDKYLPTLPHVHSAVGRVVPRSSDSPEPDKTYSDVSPEIKSALQSIRSPELRTHLEFLADDLLEGRNTGSRGATLASMYIAGQFKKIGLRAVGENNSYFQTVHLTSRRISSKSKVSIEVTGEMLPLSYGADFLVVTPAAVNGAEIEKNVIFTGFGIRAPEYGYNDFSGLDVRDKISVYLSGEPASEDSSFFAGKKMTRYATGKSKRETAREMGAAAAVGIIHPELLKRLSWEALHRRYSSPKMSLRDANESQSRLPAVILHPDVGQLFFSGVQTSFQEIEKQAASGSVASFDMHKKAYLQIFFDEHEIQGRNVAGFLEGSDPVLKSEVIVFTAHFDHLGIGVPVKNDSVYNGAADNASGVSGLLELAEAFTKLQKAPRRSLLFLAVTGEEKGLLGSEFYVEHPILPLEKTVANINLDIMGLGDTTGIVLYGKERSSLGEIFSQAAKESGLTVFPDELPEQRIFYRSDQYSFAKKGVPVIFSGFGIRRSGFDEFKTYYHRPNDDIHLPFHYHYMKKHIQSIFLGALRAANNDAPPEWVEGDEFARKRSP